MTDSRFLEHVYRYAETIKGKRLTADEKGQIVKAFNSAKGPAQDRAVQAVQEVIGQSRAIVGLRKSANLDNTKRLLADLQAAAKQWQARKP